MLPNLLLLFLVFGVCRWRRHPYFGAWLLAVIKGGLYFVAPLDTLPLGACVLNSVLGFAIFGTLGFGLVYFLRRLDRNEAKDLGPRYPTPGTDKTAFQWEYLPLSVIILTVIFGELAFNLFVGAVVDLPIQE